MSLLSTAKKLLTEKAFEVYEMRLEDVPLEKVFFRDHFTNLADTIYEIEKTKTFADLVKKLEEGCFAVLDFYEGENGENDLKAFLEAVIELG